MNSKDEQYYKINLLYGDKFCLQEFSSDGDKIGGDLRPRRFTHNFDVSDIELTLELGDETETLEYELWGRAANTREMPRLGAYLQEINDTEDQPHETKPSRIERRLRASLKTKLTQDNRSWGDPLKYFIMGNSNPIAEFRLEISTTDREEEFLVFVVSDEFNYDEKMFPSELVINVLLHKNNFEELVKSIKEFPNQKISFSCEISGAYTDNFYGSSYDIGEVKLLSEQVLNVIEAANEPFFSKLKGFTIPFLNHSLTNKEQLIKDEFNIFMSTRLNNEGGLYKEYEEKSEAHDTFDFVDYGSKPETDYVAPSSEIVKENYLFILIAFPLWTIAIILLFGLINR